MNTRTDRRTSIGANQGFTLVEIMIVIAIVGLLAIMAVPHYVRVRNYSQQNACINNLRIISSAKSQYAIENLRITGDAVVAGNINPYMRDDFSNITEPADGNYTIGNVGSDAVCSIGSPHNL